MAVRLEVGAVTARRFTKLFVLGLFFAATACSVDSAKRHYVLAEKLWTDGKYTAAVSEFEKVEARDPQGKLGTQALLRAATTEALFLSQYSDAIDKLKRFVDLSTDQGAVWEARKEIGELLFSKTEHYEQALHYYQNLVALKPDAPEVPEFMFRIGRSQYFTGHFDDAVLTYQQIVKSYGGTPWAEKASFEIGQTHLTEGEQTGTSRSAQDLFKTAMASFQGFLKQYPQSTFVPDAQFGIASCLEAMDQLDAAYMSYQALLQTYPSHNVIEIKLARIRERKAQRSR
jgi:TolA-binding protein